MNEIYLQIIHRVAFVLAIIPAMVIALLPIIFDKERDQEFAQKANEYMVLIIRVVLLVSIISGILRIPADITFIVALKITFGGLIVASFYLMDLELSHNKFKLFSLLKVGLMFVTGLVGLLI